MKEMRSTEDRANGSLLDHCWDVAVDLCAGTVETGAYAIWFAVVVLCWLVSPILIPILAWHRREAARQEVAAWEARNAHEIATSEE